MRSRAKGKNLKPPLRRPPVPTMNFLDVSKPWNHPKSVPLRWQLIRAMPEVSEALISQPDPHNFTPPATPAATSELPAGSVGDQADRDLMAEFHELQERYETTATELDQVRAKYNNSVKELEDLTGQLEDSRIVQSSSWMPRRSINSTTNHLRNSGSNFGSPSPSPILQSPSWTAQSSTPFSNHGVLPVRGFGSTVATGRSSKYAESKGIRAKESDSLEELADSGSHGPSEVFPSDSLMSRDPSSHRTITINTSQRQSHREALSGLHPIHAPSQPRDCPTLATNHRHIMVERSYESLQKEVIKLQEVLKDREDEIRGLETSIREIRRQSDSITSPLASASTDEVDGETRKLTQPIQKTEPSLQPLNTDLKHDATDVSNVSRENSIDQDSLAHPDKVLAAIQSQILLNDGDESVVKDSQNIKLLDNLMRSMAQKESAHLELIENLKDKLQSTKRQHDELVKLSRDQVVNMSSEIEALRQRLSNPSTPDPEMSKRLSKLEELLKLKEQDSESLKADSKRQLLDLEAKLLEAKQSEIKALKAEHDSVVEQLKLEQRENLNRLIASSEEKLMAKQDELRQLEDRWQSQSKAELKEQADKIRGRV
ncbi:hypothetical protein PGTUg99_000374 [Puccinia graminis f. sp. tritici]|uniref:Uncharacterized protein n=1 Tax=Puccinia graminis f. sp. tritici TaxID=56615 RepID=A0A5B0RV55_PUCGR|nr:hypothetical protein PGTUg99_000374 [Puccinia graminis f. sp. tritici]